jgi:hypothetical protein
MVTDAERRGLYDELVHVHGQEHADTMMELWPGVGWNDVARRSDIDNLRIELDAKLARLEGRMYAANAALAIAVAGLVIGAAKLL